LKNDVIDSHTKELTTEYLENLSECPTPMSIEEIYMLGINMGELQEPG
jgi:hypothetical protein